jgi:DNA polymerase-3 subunit epsilon
LTYAIIDIETTGGSFKTGRITEIAVYLHSGSRLIDEYTTLVNPEVPIPPFVAKLTGITDKMVSVAPTFSEIAKDVQNFTAGAVFVAHNANFDYNFIREEYRRLGMEFRRKRLCTVQMSRRAFPGLTSYSLDKITSELGIALNGHHRADVDALATMKLFEKILEVQSIKTLFDNYVGLPDMTGIRSPLITQDILSSIPDECGVYRFLDAEDNLIYVKRSDNMLTSICERLSNPEIDTVRKMRSDLYRIEYTETGSAMLAQLLEANLVLENLPHYNKGKFSLKTDYGIYLQSSNGKDAIVLAKRRSHDKALIYFSNFFEGLDFLKFKAKEWDKHVVQVATGHKPIPGIVLGENADAESYSEFALLSGNFLIEDEGRNIDEKTIVLVRDGLPIGFGYYDFHYAPTTFEHSDLQYHFGSHPELEMVIRKFIEKKRFERIIRLD